MVDQVNADGIMPVQGVGNLEFATDSVNAGDQHRLLKPLEFKEAAKEPRAGQDLRAEGSPGILCNQLLELIGGGNIDAGSGIVIFNLPCLLVGSLYYWKVLLPISRTTFPFYRPLPGVLLPATER